MQNHVWSDPQKPSHASTSKTGSSSNCTSTQAETYVLHEDDMISIHSFRTQNTFSTTDGIDVLGATPRPGNNVEWHVSSTGRIVTNRTFKRAIIILLFLNAIIMGVATFDFVTEHPGRKAIFDVIDNFFLLLFTVEIILRIVHQQHASRGDPWLVFDTLIIATSWMSTAIMAIRTFRTLRTLRLASKLQPLRDVVLAIGRVINRIGAILLLLLLSLYTFSVVFTGLFKATQPNFSRLDVTSWTLIQILTLDGWSDIVNTSMAETSWAWIIFLLFIVTSFILISLIVAVLVEALVNPCTESTGNKLLSPIRESPSSLQNLSRQELDFARLESKVDALSLALDLLTSNQMNLQDTLTRNITFSNTSFQRHHTLFDTSTIESDEELNDNLKYAGH